MGRLQHGGLFGCLMDRNEQVVLGEENGKVTLELTVR